MTAAGDDGVLKGTVLEVYENGGLRFGLVQEEVEGGYRAELLDENGKLNTERRVPEGEVVGLWKDEDKVENSDNLQAIVEEGRKILTNSANRALNLDPICKELQNLGKKKTLSTKDIAKRLFPTIVADSRGPAARAAAAMLVGADKIRFKRGPAGKGFVPLPKSVADTRARLEFVQHVKAKMSMAPADSAKFCWTRGHLTTLRSLEVCAASETEPNKSLKTLLKELQFEPTSAGAAELLVSVGYWSAKKLADRSRKQSSPDENTEETSSKTDEAENDSASRKGLLDWTFPEAALEEAKNMMTVAYKRRRGYADGSTAFRKDQRHVELDVYSIDEFRTKFYDDAISVERLGDSKCRLYVHVADVDAVVKPSSTVDEVALERCESMYLPKRPLHMLPPTAMEAASFSPTLPGEAISIVFDVDMKTGELSSPDVFRSIVRPIIRVTYDQFDDAIDGKNRELYPEGWLRDLELVGTAAKKLMEQRLESSKRQREIGEDRRIAGVRIVGKKTAKTEVIDFQTSKAHQVLDELLSVAGEEIRAFAKLNKCALPERRGAELFARRCGTAPMRRYVDLAIQRQIKAVLMKIELPAGRRRMIELCQYLEKRHSEVQKTIDMHRKSALFHSLAEQYADQTAAGAHRPILDAKVITVGKRHINLALLGTGLTARAVTPRDSGGIRRGAKVRARIVELDTDRQEIRAEIASIPAES
eukprot:CAMPEP_0198731778 /NCGR_PEP_ID=MMETSP1475-20131203/32098_1 /TAXON_ID= ORGANISM="Unidentified sp., Strain CCMP1999" /NCGR_SAMPLE_ID=MMETSP1475 /ASSEMBLY_ACC=CAM_ASM_001111 /LENGTH=703 /DNA_ID=CAMNT_0044494785 /DNA_START=64 /DNA_END=2175 /DNA_ORIENTATION=+